MIISDLAGQFRAALAEAGIVYDGELMADGQRHRFRPDGDHRENAVYQLWNDDHPAGWARDYKRDVYITWSAKNGIELTEAERLAWRERRAAIEAERKKAEVEFRADARARAAAEMEAGKHETGNNPYLQAKGVGAHGLRSDGDRLLVPVRDSAGTLHGLQYVFPDGTKKFLTGTAVRGHYHAIGQSTRHILIAEGYATAATLHEVTGQAVAVAFDCGNLNPVAEALRAKFPDCALIVCADNDQWTEGNPGLTKAREAARAVGAKLAVPEFGDISTKPTDFNDLHRLEAADAVRKCIEAAIDIEPIQDTEDEDIPWPVLPEAALIGVVGDIVRLATHDSEADPAAVLLTTLARAAATIGPVVYTTVGDTRHPPRLFTVLVGASSRARKGTSFGPVDRVFHAAFDSLTRQGNSPYPLGKELAVSHGPLSSGEGIVYAVRNESEALDKKTGEPVDPGIEDKRLFVIEDEFAAALRATQREGNTLSAILRSAWDHGNIAPLTKHNRIRATNAHINFVGHITHQELHVLLQTADIWNGFANRILWGAVRRTKRIPFPKPIPDPELAALATALAEALCSACSEPKQPRVFDRAAEAIWMKLYDQLTEDRPGALGAVTSRAEAQVLRLALLYSVLDPHATMIDVQHLKAAVAVWQFCDESARYIFGQSEADPDANRIMDALRERWEMTSTEINQLFQRHLSGRRIKDILQRLQASGKVTARTEGTTKNGGRKKTIWSLCEIREFREKRHG